MKKRLLPLLVLPVLLAPAVQAYDDNDFQTWIDAYAVNKIDDRWAARLEEEFKFGDNSTDFYYWHTDVGASYKANDHLVLGLNYRYIEEKKNSEWEHEDRPHANVILKQKMGAFQVEDRNRFEYRIRDQVDNFMRYRNRLLVMYPTTLFGIAASPYVSEEAFIDTDRGDFNQFRTAAGFKKKFGAAFEGDLYYLWMTTEKSTDWTDTHFLGLSAGYVF